MQLRIIPTLIAAVTIISTLVAAAPVSSDADSVFVENSIANLDAGVLKKRKTYKGTATWYKPKSEGGSEGACGGVHIDNDSEIVALNAPQYGKMSKDSKWCGKKVKITGPAGTATATIMDACPECESGDLDMTPIIFQRVAGNMSKGVADITWELV